MKRPSSSLRLALPATMLLLQGLAAHAVTFTIDTAISFNNTNYDGLEIVVTNCALTVDGVHAFASLQVLNGANLTHSPAPGGVVYDLRTFTNEQQVLSATNVATLSNANVVVSSIVVQDLSGLLTFTNNADYVIGLDTNGLTTLLLTTNSAIAEGSTNLVSYDVLEAQAATGLSLTVTGDFMVAQGGMINVDGKGYGGGAGDGRGVPSGSPASGSGASHGGYGGQSAGLTGVEGPGVTYDSIQQPSSLGSGGGTGYGGLGGAGGGCIKLTVGGTARVDGSISANGANGINERSGGGSGGTIWLSAQSFAGTGWLSANGGAGEPSQGGGGGGGRISVQYEVNVFSGSTVASGGSGYVRGGAGTIYTRANNQSAGQVLVDNGGITGEATPLSTTEAVDLTAQGGAIISQDQVGSLGNLLVASNAWISVSGKASPLTVLGNATIQAGGGIIADGAGYAGGQGPGAGRSDLNIYTAGGGGYGGFGGMGGGSASSPYVFNAYGGTPYGALTAPVDFGSGGGNYLARVGGGAGGGAIRLTVAGTLMLDGRISADGSPGFAEGSGGGAGGSVWLTAGTLTGGGIISAKGGLGNGFGSTGGGGGGGGRIAIQYGSYLYFGASTAQGGSGSAWGGAGTIYTKANSQAWGQVVVDNGGQAGANTSWLPMGTIDLTVKGGAAVVPPSVQTIGTLLVASNGWLTVSNQVLTVTGNATVQSGGGIIADSAGYAASSGPGAGEFVSFTYGYIGGGGGYGGHGAAGASFSSPSSVLFGGSTYGSVNAPTGFGSGGGSYSSMVMGGAGGGAVRLNVTGVLQVDGRISATGGAGVNPNGGGGSGGTISLTAGTLSGMGVISANGGMGNSLGGGGGGGRLAIVYGSYDFAGVVTAYGGGGYATGGAGTIYTKASNQSPFGQVVVDNGGQAGTNTTFGSENPGMVDLTVKNGAVFSPPSFQMIGSLLVASNGWVTVAYQALTVTGNATIQAGGGIIADSGGHAAGAGPGAGKYSSSNSGNSGGGGGYGGYGGAGGTLAGYFANGGNTYGSVITPVDLGSGGGTYNTIVIGGAGGGVVSLKVTGVLQMDGRISATGGAGITPGGGGGSGGSVFLTAGTLAGSGEINANGGMGNLIGGGGGGGRVAIAYGSYDFSGVVSAYGGGGSTTGGAGTIYTKANSQSFGQVVMDNGGQAGTNTTFGLASPGTVELTVKNGAVFSPPNTLAIGTLLVASNGWVSVANQEMMVTGDATVQAGGGIIADGTGSPAGKGAGAGRYEGGNDGFVGGGGGYGGYGATGGGTPYAYGGTTYGSATEPTDLGSGGGGPQESIPMGGAGGGAIRLTVTGTLQVGGRISARGQAGTSPSAGGGSGGSINLSVGTLAGSGVISANGGAGSSLGGGGGGGRIAIAYKTGQAFSGLISAYGGSGYAIGGAGTIYLPASNDPTGRYGLLLVDNGGQAGTNTSWTAFGSTYDLTVKGGAVVAPSGSLTVGSLIVGSNGWVVLKAIQGTVPTLTMTGDAAVQAGGGIIADGTGYPAGQGQGAGRYYVPSSLGNVSSGGGYGGNGGRSGGNEAVAGGNNYGGVTQPMGPGSGGGSFTSALYGGAGGGGVRLNVTGTLQVDGRISAAGGAATSANFGGGSGGSVWLTAGTLAGGGAISANGGAGNGLGGGGGGGRIALQYGANAFSGVLSAYGGGGYAWGGAGTIYTKANNQPWGQLVVDNGGQAGTNTSWAASGTVDLTVKGGAVVALPFGQTLGNLLVASNGWISLGFSSPATAGLVLTVSSNAIIQVGGGIIADGTGYAGGQGPGAGKYAYSSTSGNVGGGGGYGGFGATSGGATPGSGGSAYGWVTSPLGPGSGGGSPQGSTVGGEGGGGIRMTVNGALLVNGRISANGRPGLALGSGGGSGGSVWLTAGTLAGGGVISANGGAGNELGGGGGGGRIYLQYSVNTFGGAVSAYGGGGFAWGGAGTIGTEANTASGGQVLVDNGGNYGTNTPLPYLPPFDLTVRGGAVAYPSGPNLILSNLFINAGGSFTCTKAQTNLDVAILRNAFIDAGGVVTVDGNGFAEGAGPGAGLSTNSIGSGAGYGGNGGASSRLPGGPTYGSAQLPVDRGSGGGLGSGLSAGGSEGGGAIRFTVGGALTVNGLLSADGNDALQDNSGGGSGGSIWLAAFALAGTGLIAADGGAGELYQGGGGGGGRIAIYAPVNVFAGLVLAAGAAGASPGQTGSVFYAAALAVPQVASMTPVGTITAAVSSIEIAFSTPVNPYSVVAPNVGLTAPGGVAVDNLTATALSPYRFQITFPVQTARGDYTLTVGPQVEGLSGQPMSQAYMGTFSIVWPMVQGAVTDTNGLPVPDVLLQADGGIAATTTDTNGNYVLSLPPDGTINVVPSKAGLMFVPSSRSYAYVTTPIANENYLAVGTVAPALTTQVQTNMYILSWYGIPGVTYQPLYSTNLMDWVPYDVPLPGTNGPLQLVVPMGTEPNMFFRVGASY